jgi:hypothetical protein
MDFVGGCLAGDEVHLNLEVLACFAESCVGGLGENHLGLGHVALFVRFVAGGEACHEDTLGAAGCRNTYCVFRGVKEGEDLFCQSSPGV